MTKNRRVFTWNKLEPGTVFEFKANKREKPYEGEEVIDLWTEFENNGLGERIIYGQAKVFAVPANPNSPYMAKVESWKQNPQEKRS